MQRSLTFAAAILVAGCLFSARAQDAKDRILATPNPFVIANHEGVVEFKPLQVTGKDGETFKVKTIHSERNLININGPMGFEIHKQEYLVYLASTLQAGSYQDTIVFTFSGKTSQKELRVPVTITIKADGKSNQASVQPASSPIVPEAGK
jgi:hypothetical protein